ncbi:diphthamide biosynthesis protein 2 [Alligator mississippiensis]|uniref:2-(3-amino-3-carboxypropyl)histidine synthase subunit 2 n=1 Tax=Alligator mississippiensis TaxID=8496 RepID=A0A151NDN5_ALLMI|nr:diphthamide biosynthesis protein 2 [Alligator mississippiensis]
MAAAFNSDGAEAIGRALPGPGERGPARSGPLADFYELRRAAAFVRARGLRKVALQFPDELLEDAAAVAARMEEATGAAMYVLGDTSYDSCCVDEVAAEHAGAQAVVHYGPACLSPCRRLPVLHVFGRRPLDVERCARAFRQLHPDPRSRTAVLSDVVYAHAMDELEQRLRPDYPHVVFSRLLCEAEPVPDPDPSLLRQFGRELPEAGLEGGAVFYVGGEGLPLTNLMLSWNRCAFSSFDPATGRARRESLDVNRALRRRLYLVERARDARAVGILVGTLGVAGYREALRHLRDTLRRAGKRSYTLAVGKPSPTKLANFPELDVFVLVACAQNSLLDSHGFYRPVVTPFELELACNPARTWTGSYLTDFRDLLPGSAWPGGSSWGSGGLSTLLPHRPGAGTPPPAPWSRSTCLWGEA